MTEDDAKEKWCPFARRLPLMPSTGAPSNGIGYTMNGAPLDREARCIASACMAWRWEPELRGYSQEVRPGEQSQPLKPIYTGLLSKTEGRCGLAG